MRRRIVVVWLACSVVTGCGGGASGSDERMRRAATRICNAANRRLERLKTPAVGPGDKAFLNRGIPVLEGELRQLGAQRGDGEDQPVYTRALSAMAGEIVELRRAVGALGAHQDAAMAFAALQRRLAPLETRADDAWRALQVPACLSR